MCATFSTVRQLGASDLASSYATIAGFEATPVTNNEVYPGFEYDGAEKKQSKV
jgi:hypothetical protein